MAILILCCPGLLAQSVQEAARTCARLIRDASGFEIGFLAVDARSGRVVAAHGPDLPLIPASNQKVLTGAAAWFGPGPDHPLATELIAHGVLAEGTLHGCLRLRGEGDPSLESESAPAAFARRVATRGIRRIRGDLVMDDTAFSDAFTGPNWPKDEPTRSWMAEVAALSLDNAMVEIVVTGGGADGARAEARIRPEASGWTLDNRLTTCEAAGDQVIHVRRLDDTRTLIATGRVWRDTRDQAHGTAIHDPVLVFGSALMGALQEAGIQVEGRMRRPGKDERFASGHVLGRTESPVVSILPAIMKNSQNHRAEMLFKHLGYLEGGDGSFAGGGAAVSSILERERVPLGNAALADGSGLSRDNRVTARGLVAVLKALAGRPDFDRFLELLPAGGEASTTLSRRLKDLGPRARAKTGTLSTVVALSGYVRSEDGRWIAFSFLANAPAAGQVGNMRSLCDDLVRALARVHLHP